MKPSFITPEQFISWRKNLGWTRVWAARQLGISKSSIDKYETGKRSDSDDPVKVPMTVALAMSALSHGLKAYGMEDAA